MSFLTKFQPLNSINKTICQHYFRIFNFSTLAKRRRSPSQKPHKHNTQKHPAPKKVDNDNDNASLFSEITEILGSLDKTPSGYSLDNSPFNGLGRKGSCTPGVCENVKQKNELESEVLSIRRDTQMVNLSEDDVSEVVHRITEVVRADNAGINSMEDRLDKLGCELSSEIVDKVLKRCFKVPHLAARFFDWVSEKNGGCVTTETYNTMIYLAGEARDFELVERLVKEMGDRNCERDVKTWTILFMHYGKARRSVGKALLIFEKMRKSGFEPDAEAYILMIRLLCESGKGEIALEFYKEMVQKHAGMIDIRVYKLLVNCLAACGDIDGVYLVANDMINLAQIPEDDVYSTVLKSFCISQRITEALKLIRDLKNKNLRLSPEYFETLVKGLCKADRMTDALEIVDIMEKRNVVNEVVYGSLINGYLRKKDTAKALGLFNGMKEAGLTPLTATYTILMQHLFNSNDYEKGCVLFDEMMERGMKLDAVAYMAMIAGHVRHDHISAAWKLFETMEKEGVRATQKSYSVLIKELCRSSRTSEIIKVLKRMQDSKVNIGKEISDCVLSYLERKKGIIKLEEVTGMQRFFGHYHQEVDASKSVSSEGVIHNGESIDIHSNVNCLLLEPLPRTFTIEDMQKICTILSSSKDWSSMQEALEKSTFSYTPDLVTEILRSCSKCGCAALNFFSWVGKKPGYRHTTDSYNMAIKIAGQGKEFSHMRSLFYEMQRNRCVVTSDTWTIMIMLYGRVGLTDIALKNFDEMKASGLKANTSTYKYLILSLCGRKGRKVDEAFKLFKEMTKQGLVPDKELVEGLFDRLCRAEKLADAKKCLDYLHNVGFTTLLSYSLLIRALCRRGNLEEALALANDVDEKDRSTLDHYVYGSVIHALLQKGEIDKAMDKIDSMKQLGIHPTVHVYTSLVSHFCKEKQINRALDVFKTMWEEGCLPTIVTYTTLICGYLNMGNVEEARKLFLRMRVKGPFPDFKAYSMLIGRFCEMGKSETALKMLSEMLDDGIVPSTVNFRTVFFGLNREGKRGLAQKVMQQKRAVAYKRKFVTYNTISK